MITLRISQDKVRTCALASAVYMNKSILSEPLQSQVRPASLRLRPLPVQSLVR